ncbi:hypothetical protein F5X96DRAFT_612979 [Biscogniauxia mediterranea]|nr:hypothetical protein F5X96DRAFT_612979 [Biscogniauxia mediterranea]
MLGRVFFSFFSSFLYIYLPTYLPTLLTQLHAQPYAKVYSIPSIHLYHLGFCVCNSLSLSMLRVPRVIFCVSPRLCIYVG